MQDDDINSTITNVFVMWAREGWELSAHFRPPLAGGGYGEMKPGATTPPPHYHFTSKAGYMWGIG